MRKINYMGNELDLTSFSDLSTNYDKTRFNTDTEYVTIDIAVLGNKMGINTIDGVDQSSALAAIHGRKYNNGRISIPFERDYVSKNYARIDKAIQDIAEKATSQCSELQMMMSPEEVAQGREAAMRSQAIRDAKTEILASGSILDMKLFNEANRSVRANVASKVYFQHGVSVSGRRVKDTEGIESKGLYKRKNISSESGATNVAYVATADEAGLKKVPIMTKDMRDIAEKMVYDFALVAKEAVSKIGPDVTGDACLICLEEIAMNMPSSGTSKIEIPDYTDEEYDKIEAWKNEIIENYRA